MKKSSIKKLIAFAVSFTMTANYAFYGKNINDVRDFTDNVAELFERPDMVSADDVYTYHSREELENALAAAGRSSVLSASNFSASDEKEIIILSNTDPSVYRDMHINFTRTGSDAHWNLKNDNSVSLTDSDGKNVSLKFIGLGSDAVPFAGEITYTEGSFQNGITCDRPFFNNISDTAAAEKMSFVTPENMKEPVFARKISDGDSESAGTLSTQICCQGQCGGLVGELCENAVFSAEISESAESTAYKITGISGKSDTGTFCGIMRAGSKLNVKNITVSYSVSSSSGNAGGIVGSAYGNSKISFENNFTFSGSVSAVSTYSAGGIVGYGEDCFIGESQGTTSRVTVSSATVSGGNAGGIYGYFKYTGLSPVYEVNAVNCSAEKINFKNAEYAGGITGKLENTCSVLPGAKFIVSGDGSKVISTASCTSVKNYGGITGSYSSSLLESAFEIKNIKTVCKSGALTTGGLIGLTQGGSSYIKISDTESDMGTVSVSCEKSGGVAAYCSNTVMLDIGNVKVSGKMTPNASVYAGGIVGFLESGVMRFSGKADISCLSFDSANCTRSNVGQITGWRNLAVVYAESTATLFRKPEGSYISDIGNYGEVVRIKERENAGESLSGLFSFDENSNEHTVTLAGFDPLAIGTVKDFAALSVAMQAENENDVLKITTPVSVSGNIVLTSDIDLFNTGITGITRDGYIKESDGTETIQTYSGVFDGNNNAVTLSYGNNYGNPVDNLNGHGQIYSHPYAGLFGKISGSTIKNVTVKGTMSFSSGTDVQYAGAVAGYAEGNCIFTGVISSALIQLNESDKESGTVYAGGFAGYVPDNNVIVFESCKWDGTIKDNQTYSGEKLCYSLGGFVGYIGKNDFKTLNKQIKIDSCTVSGTINAASARHSIAGGLIGSLNFDYSENNSTEASLHISNLAVSGCKVTTDGSATSGGLLGYFWNNTKVVFSGVTVTGSELESKKGNNFGGLVYSGSGLWDVQGITFSGAGANVNKFTGKTNTDIPSGLIVCRGDDAGRIFTGEACDKYLYLTVEKDAYTISQGSVELTSVTSGSQFDEVCGISVGDTGNSVISFETDSGTVDSSGCNTYQKQISDFVNDKTRYYYNTVSIRGNAGTDCSTVNSADKLMCWSLYHYAGKNIKGFFAEKAGNIITGKIDLTGYSYYPVDYHSDVTVSNALIIFDNSTIEAAEVSNRKTTDSKRQHYMMQYGLFKNYTIEGNTAVEFSLSNTELNGNIGADSNYSGALICGDSHGIQSGVNSIQLTVKCKELKMNGLTGKTDRPLLFNSFSDRVKLTSDGMETVNYSTGVRIAGSLIGSAGFVSQEAEGAEAKYISLTFKNMKLDDVFSKAYFMESFSYLKKNSDTCGGSYTFNKADTRVTYGREISNGFYGLNGRNAGEQWHYFDDSSARVTYKDASGNDSYDFSQFTRYVKTAEDSENCHELDINQSVMSMSGCGTYADPYIITDGEQLESLARYLSGNADEGWTVSFDKENLTKKTDDHDHVSGADESKYHVSCTVTSGEFTGGASGSDYKTYLRNAYYLISDNISLGESGSFFGIGDAEASTNAFCGVIAGKNLGTSENPVYPTITISAPDSESYAYGGLIKYSNGSVVKDLKIEFVSTVRINNDKLSSERAKTTNGTGREPINQSFFGGVIGYIIGGDNIIDNVKVSIYGGNLQISGKYDYMTNAGGYVGMIGGSIKEGGGVIFRNMSGNAGGYSGLNSVNANGTWIDTTTEVVTEQDMDKGNIVKSTGNQNFYWNPYVGRVLDGFACYEPDSSEDTTELNNTDKNYKIPSLSSASVVNVTGNIIDISSKQDLWVVSAITNSGAGSMKSDGKYDSSSYAYYYGKIRTGKYDSIGSSITGDSGALLDEKYWGGTTKSAKEKKSVLISRYTGVSDDSSYSLSHVTANDYSYGIKINTDCEMTSYGNGFRGIGTSFEDNVSENVQKRCMPLISFNGNEHKITLNRNVYEYSDDASGWWTQGIGLFPVLYHISKDDMSFSDALFSGDVNIFYIQSENYSGSVDYIGECSAGAFAGLTANGCSSALKTITFDNMKLKTLTVKGAKYSGGYIGVMGVASRTTSSGLSYIGSSTNFSYDFENCGYDDINVEGSYSAGGFAGVFKETKGNSKLTFSGKTSITNSKIGWTRDACLEMFIISNNKEAAKVNGYSGGSAMVGFYYGAAYSVNNLTTDDIYIYAPQFAYNCDYGLGMVAGFIHGDSGALTLDNSKFKNTTIEIRVDPDYKGQHVNDRSYWVAPASGTLVGYSKTTNSIKCTNVSVSGTTILNGAYAGGMVGNYASGIFTIKGGGIDNVLIYTRDAHSYDDTPRTGGVVGALNAHLTISDKFTLKNCNIVTDGRSGIIVGSTKNPGTEIKVSDALIENCNAVTTERYITGKSFAQGNTDPGSSNAQKNNSNNAKCGAGVIVGLSVVNKGTVSVSSIKSINVYNTVLKNSMTGYYLTGKDGISYDKTEKKLMYTRKETVITDMGTEEKTVTVPLVLDENSVGLYSGTEDGISYSEIKNGTEYIKNNSEYLGLITGGQSSGIINIVGLSVQGGFYPPEINGCNNTNVSNSTTVFSNFDGVDCDASANAVTKPNIKIDTDKYLTSDGFSESAVTNILKTDYTGTEWNWNRFYNAFNPNAKNEYEINAEKSNFLQNGLYYNYFSTYKTVQNSTESSSYCQSSGDDFPVLIIDTNKSADIDKLIKSYVSVLTNCYQKSTARWSSISTSAYKYDGSKFVQSSPSLKYVNSAWQVPLNAFDNGIDQFTVVSFKYVSAIDSAKTYELNIPVIVKKIQNVSVYASVLNGTEYYKSVYEGNQNAVLARNGDKITARIDYNYYGDKNYWQSMVNDGNNLLWNYKKSIYPGALPKNTRLTLVDTVRNGFSYESILSASIGAGTELNFDSFKSINDNSAWEVAPICKVLNLKRTSVYTSGIVLDSFDSEKSYFVETTVKSNATLIYNEVYYRPADADEIPQSDASGKYTGNNNLYTFEVQADINESDPEMPYITETYFITIETPAGYNTIINNTISYKKESLDFTDGGTPSQLINNTKVNSTAKLFALSNMNDKTEHSDNKYVLGKLLDANSEVNTYSDANFTYKNGANVTVSEINSKVYAEISSKINFSSDATRNYAEATDIYHRFVLYPEYYFDDNSSLTTEFMPGMKYKYTVGLYRKNGDKFEKIEGTELKSFPAAASVELTEKAESIEIEYGSSIRSDMTTAYNKNYDLYVVARVELDYSDEAAMAVQFPEKSQTDSYPGIKLSADSQIRFKENGLPVYDINRSDASLFSIDKINSASLRYYAYDNLDTGDGSGKISQIGINASDSSSNSGMIYTQGDYDYSVLNYDTLQNAAKIRYEISLEQKTDTANGPVYKKVDIDKYLEMNKFSLENQNEKEGETVQEGISTVNGVNEYTRTAPWNNGTGDSGRVPADSILIQFRVKTGNEDPDETTSDFQNNSFFYSNYRVTLNVKLLDKDDNEISGSLDADYIIYTNARIAVNHVKDSD